MRATTELANTAAPGAPASAVIQACKEHDFEIPLQFGNFRD